ncbi:MAG: preprotein translocase subunit SecG [Lentisphaeria bacterium]|nr:preprotein translocase subunit SecG [Candidatus Neomarinimicrobiota bacterium]MCF7842249.1 preprotein translocase subunit SecG [Lentisphaeria bacterium]
MVFLYIVLAFVSLSLMIVILMQSSKGGGLAGTFGGAASTTNALFGAGTGNFLTKLTTGLAITFMVLIILISVLNKGSGSQGGQSVIQQSANVPSAIVPGTQFDAQDMAVPTDQTEGENALPAGGDESGSAE